MFYSQFILAKKGPLGTIWIAAHLERKLRKNQVADTDIGVSVDSILFPEVPIALRLSSHLLMGVVRIYSRKVNYLFDDCSEALLKVKQAFRSTAVDLPPEESTAPYHSITLPETFDLDDFELPENELFQGNFVDHHVSSREQITLQDNMDNVAYASSQFGLDERFGDGDTSQIGLDLEEEMLLVKASAPGQDGVIKTAPQELDETVVKEEPSNLEAMEEDGNGDQINDLDEASELPDYAQAPATPGLVEVSNMSNIKERLTFDDHMESEDHHLTAVAAAEHGEDISEKLEHHCGDQSSEHQSLSNEQNHDSLACMPRDNGYDETLKDQTRSLVGSLSNTMSAEYTLVNGNKEEDKVIASTDCMSRTNGEPVESPSCSNVTFDLEDPNRINVLASEKGMENENDFMSLKPESPDNAKTTNNDEESYIPSKETTPNAASQLESPSRATVVDDETQTYQGLNKYSTHEDVSSVGTHTMKPCNTLCNQQNAVSHECGDLSVLPDMQSAAPEQLSVDNLSGENEHDVLGASTEGQGERCQSQMSDPDTCERDRVAGRKSDERPDNAISGANQVENSDNYNASELPAPEKLLSVPESLPDRPNDLLVESTPDKEVPAADDEIGATKAVSGKKRSYTESTLTMESINSAESFGGNRSKRTAECVPDDDDLLSSILVGRRSSVLKMKSTPAFEVASKKRVRSVTRTSAIKRKVLLDDTMVLHGDAIREQLTSTEDIRRVRKKAPCTRLEICMIQRQFLEHEIFAEPIFSGICVELVSLYSGSHDLSRIMISEGEDNNPPEVPNDIECSIEPKVMEENGIEDSFMRIGHSSDAQLQSDGNVQIETRCSDDDIGTQQHLSSGPDVPQTFEGETLDTSELHVDQRSAEAADAANMFGMDEMMNLANPITTDFDNMFDGETQILDASQSKDALCILPDQHMNTETAKESTTILSDGDPTNHVEALDHTIHDTIVRAEPIVRGDNVYEESGGTLADISTDHPEYSDSINNQCGFPPTSLDWNPGLDEEKQNVQKEDIVIAASSELNDQGPSFNDGEEPKPNFLDPVEHNLCNENTSANAVENQMWGMDAVHMETTHDLVGENRSEFEDVAVVNDTDFLNLDDDEVAEDDDDEMPSTEDRQLLENSGWSSRTRAVANYLQNLFDNENVRGHKVLSTDRLLTGKTRKEAARMFFETLVLKTKDYIQVEQPEAFSDISIKPGAKLMKSIF